MGRENTEGINRLGNCRDSRAVVLRDLDGAEDLDAFINNGGANQD
jgi:hypothetical protein